MINPFRLSNYIQFRVLCLMLVSVTTILGISGALAHQDYVEELLASYAAMQEAVIERLAQGAAIPLWEINNDALKDLINAEIKNRDVTAIIVQDQSGSVLESVRKDKDGTLVGAKGENKTLGESRSTPVHRDGNSKEAKEKIGLIEVQFSRASVEASIRQSIVNQIAEILLVDFAIAISLYAGLRLVFRPLLSFESALRDLKGNIQIGKSATPLKVSNVTEMARVERGLNSILEEIDKSAKNRERYLVFKNRLAELSRQLEKTEKPYEFSDHLFKFANKEWNCLTATFYIRDRATDDFVLSGAFNNERIQERRFKIGQGTLGQVAERRKILALRGLESGQLIFATSLVKLSPACIFIIPVTLGEFTIGLMELGFLNDFNFDEDVASEAFVSIANDLELLRIRLEMRRQLKERIEAEERTRLIISSVKDGIVGLNAEGAITFINPTGAALLGGDVKFWIGKRMPSPIAGDASTTVIGDEDHSTQSPVSWFPRAGGEPFPAEYSESPIIQGEMKIGSVIAFKDVTDRYKMEQSVRDTERWYRTMFESAVDGIVVAAADSKVVYGNLAAERILRYGRNDLVGMSVESFLAPEERARARSLAEGIFKRDAELRAQGERGVELNGLDSKGKNLPLEMTISYMPKIGDREEALCISFRNISERKAAETELRRVHYALEHATDSVVWFDKNGQIVDVNLAFAEMAGKAREEIFGEFIGTFFGEMTNVDWGAYWASQKTSPEDVVKESKILCIDGTSIDVEIASRFIEFGGEEFVCCFIRDIRRRKQFEKEILSAKAAAEDATKAKSSFLAMMSHEIRTPMNGIMSMAEMLSGSGLNEDQRDMASVILSSSDALLTIINDILDFSKIEAGKLEIESVEFVLSDIIEDVGDLIGPRAYSKGLNLVCDLDVEQGVRVAGDPNRIRQIILNLAGNAVKFTERGHVKLALLKKKDVESNRVLFRFEVHDTGIGLTKEQSDKLFQPFQQADVSTSRKFGGTGLGLSISKRLIELMNGSIGVESVAGQGSVFWFELPLQVLDRDTKRLPVSFQGIGVCIVSASSIEAGILDRYIRSAGGRDIEIVPAELVESSVARLLGSNRFVVVLASFRDSAASSHLIPLLTKSHRPELKTIFAAPREMLSTIAYAKGNGADVVLSLPMKRDKLIEGVGVATGQISAISLSETSGLDNDEWVAPSNETARNAGVLILVAEDNKTNQVVIERILNRLGFAHEIANDGIEALEKYKTGNYGLILSDYHMPRLDGFGLTKAIRDIEAVGGGRTPVIALTADAMAGTEKNCIDAGMDGFLTKPIKIEWLKAALEKWIPSAFELRKRRTKGRLGDDEQSKQALPVPEISRKAEPVNPRTEKRFIDPDIFDCSRLEETFGAFDDGAIEFLSSFLDEAAKMIVRLESCLNKGDAAEARHEAHALKGASRSMGANRLGNLASDIQDYIDNGSLDVADTLSKALVAAHEELQTEVSQLIQSKGAAL